jgi:AbrB family looped-hinge helix DNA binding protein
LSKARVKRKGQVTIPLEFRSELGIEEGTVLDIKSQDGALILRPEPPIEPGEVVGEEEYNKIIAELDRIRRNWR